MPDKKANVHEYYPPWLSDETSRFGIGIWSDRNAQYTAPLDSSTRRLTGCSAEFSRYPIGSYKTIRQARRRARLLYGYSKRSY